MAATSIEGTVGRPGAGNNFCARTITGPFPIMDPLFGGTTLTMQRLGALQGPNGPSGALPGPLGFVGHLSEGTAKDLALSLPGCFPVPDFVSSYGTHNDGTIGQLTACVLLRRACRVVLEWNGTLQAPTL